MTDEERLAAGTKRRRATLGDAWVDKSVKNRNPFNADFQDLITRYAWGDIWTRGVIDDQTRRLLVLAQMIALNRVDEFKLHLRAALTHGVPVEAIKEVLMQSAIYCGVPAANTAFHWASEVFSSLEQEA